MPDATMTDYTRTIGKVELVSLTDGHGSESPTGVFPASTAEIWKVEYPELLDEQGLFHPRWGCVAVRSSGKLVIVDTGDGPPAGTLMDDMRYKGVQPEDVDFVLTTHLHGDHIGWNMTSRQPTFPKARYLVPKADYEYWTSAEVLDSAPTPGDSRPKIQTQVMPLLDLGVMDLIEGEHQITEEVAALPTPGHTPGHTSVSISSAGEQGFIPGDVTHTPAQAHYTNWSPTADVDPDVARSTRHRVIDRLERDGSLVSAGHYPAPGFGRFARKEGRRYWQTA